MLASSWLHAPAAFNQHAGKRARSGHAPRAGLADACTYDRQPQLEQALAALGGGGGVGVVDEATHAHAVRVWMYLFYAWDSDAAADRASRVFAGTHKSLTAPAKHFLESWDDGEEEKLENVDEAVRQAHAVTPHEEEITGRGVGVAVAYEGQDGSDKRVRALAGDVKTWMATCMFPCKPDVAASKDHVADGVVAAAFAANCSRADVAAAVARVRAKRRAAHTAFISDAVNAALPVSTAAAMHGVGVHDLDADGSRDAAAGALRWAWAVWLLSDCDAAFLCWPEDAMKHGADALAAVRRAAQLSCTSEARWNVDAGALCRVGTAWAECSYARLAAAWPQLQFFTGNVSRAMNVHPAWLSVCAYLYWRFGMNSAALDAHAFIKSVVLAAGAWQHVVLPFDFLHTTMASSPAHILLQYNGAPLPLPTTSEEYACAVCLLMRAILPHGRPALQQALTRAGIPPLPETGKWSQHSVDAAPAPSAAEVKYAVSMATFAPRVANLAAVPDDAIDDLTSAVQDNLVPVHESCVCGVRHEALLLPLPELSQERDAVPAPSSDDTWGLHVNSSGASTDVAPWGMLAWVLLHHQQRSEPGAYREPQRGTDAAAPKKRRHNASEDELAAPFAATELWYTPLSRDAPPAVRSLRGSLSAHVFTPLAALATALLRLLNGAAAAQSVQLELGPETASWTSAPERLLYQTTQLFARCIHVCTTSDVPLSPAVTATVLHANVRSSDLSPFSSLKAAGLSSAALTALTALRSQTALLWWVLASAVRACPGSQDHRRRLMSMCSATCAASLQRFMEFEEVLGLWAVFSRLVWPVACGVEPVLSPSHAATAETLGADAAGTCLSIDDAAFPFLPAGCGKAVPVLRVLRRTWAAASCGEAPGTMDAARAALVPAMYPWNVVSELVKLTAQWE